MYRRILSFGQQLKLGQIRARLTKFYLLLSEVEQILFSLLDSWIYIQSVSKRKPDKKGK